MDDWGFWREVVVCISVGLVHVGEDDSGSVDLVLPGCTTSYIFLYRGINW